MSIIFLSHASQDVEICNLIKADIERSFLGLCTVFVSSNLESITAGSEWISEIKENITNCSVFLGLVSPYALSRPWIYFEFGAVWLREIPVIPICVGRQQRSQLPPPLSAFQAIELNDVVHLEHLYRRISEKVGCRVPEIDFVAMRDKYYEVAERKYSLDMLRFWVKQIKQWNPDFSKLFSRELDECEIMIPSHSEAMFVGDFVQESRRKQFLEVQHAGVGMGTRVGAVASIFKVTRDVEFEQISPLVDVQD